MDSNVVEVLQEYEEMIKEGRIARFYISILDTSLLIRTDDSSLVKRRLIPITQELQASLSTFFYEIDAIDCTSSNYATLKSLINAHTCISRITGKNIS